MSYKDHFSKQSKQYAASRPSYPEELFSFLTEKSPGKELAWDVGTGNGQAALSLAEYFERVIATDPSEEQIDKATPHPKVEYRVEAAEDASLDDHSVDLITVSTALHWFDFDAFYREVRRVAKPQAIIAAWTYHLPTIEPGIDRLAEQYMREVLAGYWPDRFDYVDNHYETIPFPFEEIEPPQISMQSEWNLQQVLQFMDSWSATQQYKNQNDDHPLDQVIEPLTEAWGDEETQKTLVWPLAVKVGRVEA